MMSSDCINQKIKNKPENSFRGIGMNDAILYADSYVKNEKI